MNQKPEVMQFFTKAMDRKESLRLQKKVLWNVGWVFSILDLNLDSIFFAI